MDSFTVLVVDALKPGTNVEERAIVLVHRSSQIRRTPIMLDVIPVAHVGILVELLGGLDTLDTDPALHHSPALVVVGHEWVARARNAAVD